VTLLGGLYRSCWLGRIERFQLRIEHIYLTSHVWFVLGKVRKLVTIEIKVRFYNPTEFQTLK
jgi:hypothetical protein